MSLKTVQVASILDISRGKYMLTVATTRYKAVWYEVLPFVIDCKLARTDSNHGGVAQSTFAALYHTT